MTYEDAQRAKGHHRQTTEGNQENDVSKNRQSEERKNIKKNQTNFIGEKYNKHNIL